MKNNQGITTMQIVITVIVMLILLSIAIFYGQGTSKEATISALYNEIREVSSAIQEASALNQIKVSGEEIIFFGETSAQKVEKTAYADQLANAGEGEFYFLDFTGSKDLKHTLELENVKNDYILNFNTLKLYLKDGISLTNESGNEELKYSAEEITHYYNNVFDYSQSPKETYLITYNTNGGNDEIASQTAPIGINITITSQRPTREGYTFIGWAKSSGETNATYLPGSIYKFNGNTTLYAVWKESNFDAIVIMNGYQYGGTKSIPRIEGETNDRIVTYYYNTIDRNQNGTLWSKVTNSTSLNAGTYYMYATVAKDSVTSVTPTTVFIISKANGSINYTNKTITKSLNDDSFKNILSKIGDGKVTYISSDPNVATVDTSGIVTIVGGGKTTITAEVEDGTNYTYATKTASYELTVTKSNFSATVNMNDYVYAGEMSQPTVTGNLESGDVKYYYSDTNQNSNGAIWNNMTSTSLNAGTYYMYAVIAETANYNEFTTQPVEFTIEKADAKLSLASREINKKTNDDPFINELTDTGNGTIRYSSSNTGVAIVAENGEVTIQGAGEAIIIATVTPGQNYKYEYTTITYTLKVEQAVLYLMQRNVDKTDYVIGYGRTGCTSESYEASSIKTITLENTKTIPSNYVASWDVSANEDGTIKAYLLQNGKMYDMHIIAYLGKKGKITAPESCSRLFSNYTNCVEINNLELLDTSNVTDMTYMFDGCNKVAKLNVSGFVTSQVTNMKYMFGNGESLETLDVSKWNTTKVTNMRYMFADCSNLENLNVTNFKTDKVTDMQYMFAGCGKLTVLNVSNFKTSYVTNMESMFYKCSALTSLDLSSFNTSQVTSMAGMFWECSSLTNLDLSNFDTRNVTKMNNMFVYCYNLSNLKLGEYFDRLIGENTFSLDGNLKSIITSRTKLMELGTEINLGDYCTLYVPNETAERLFESGEGYYNEFGTSVYNKTRDDGTLDLYYIRTLMELSGDSTTYVEIGSSYTEQGVTVAGMNANDDGTYTPFGYTVSSSIKDRSGNVVNEIDTSKAGTYIVTYKLSDASGEIAGVEVSRTVKAIMIHSVANGPILNTSEMKAVYWNESGDEFETTSFELAQTEEGTIYNTTLYNYNYSFDDDIYELGTDTYDVKWAVQPRWANAKTTSDGSYWVWIPRYAYKITYYTGSDKKTVSETKTQYGSIDVIFLKGTSDNQYIDENRVTYTGLPDGYRVHPAFQKMETEEDLATNPLGKWSEELTGIWVAKYEASQEVSENGTKWTTRNVESETEGNILTTNAGNKENVRVVSKPSVNSWRCIANKYIYQNCLKMNKNLNTHQMKNSEWGAVAYLTYSVYGRNGNELSVNQCLNYFTGAGPSADGIYGSNTYTCSDNELNSTYGWKTSLGKLASTTGNIYGIYDMSGGTWEYTASYVNNGSDILMTHGNDLENSGDNLVNGSGVAKTIENMKTKQIYLSTTTSGEDTQEVDYNLCKDAVGNLLVYGDAVYETSTSPNNNNGWCSDYSDFPASSYPFFLRGGGYKSVNGAGVFFLTGSSGGNSSSGFRPVICITSSK